MKTTKRLIAMLLSVITVMSRLIGRIFQYIDYSKTGSPINTSDGKGLYVAAQVLVWEVTQGERDANFNYVAPPAGYDRVKQKIDNASISASTKNMINVITMI